MSLGLVYEWQPDPEGPLGGSVALVMAELPNLDPESGGLKGRFVRVTNRGMLYLPDPETGHPAPEPIGDAQADNDGNFYFEPGRGGGRIDKVEIGDAGMRRRYVQATHFGEVNTYFHLDRAASYAHRLLGDLGATSLPPVTAVVCAHNCAFQQNGERDAIRRLGKWVPFEGGHYRLPARRYDISERYPIEPAGEIHLGPGRHLVHEGALVDAAGGRYRANASHNAGILYHEYGHHIVRHTADFRANRCRPVEQQKNTKTALDEGTSDYWAATILETPHIWAWHRPTQAGASHPRSLSSSKTMADFDHKPGADPHRNGTICAAALWDMRRHIAAADSGGASVSDMLVLKALLLLGAQAVGTSPKPESTEGGGRVSALKRQEGAPVLLG